MSLKLAGGLAGLMMLCSLPSSAVAQDNTQSPPQQQQEQTKPRHHKKTHRLLAKLNLNNNQKAQIKQIHQNAKSQVVVVTKDTSMTTDQKKAKIREIRQNARKQIDQLFTPAQRQQLQAEIQQMKETRQQKQQAQHQAQPQG